MNNEDLAVLEHSNMVRQSNAQVESHCQANHELTMQQIRTLALEQEQLDDMAALGGMAVALKMRGQNQVLANLQRKFSEQNAVISAMHTAVDSLTTSLAKQRNAARDELAGRVSGLMTEVFDSRIEEYMEQGSLDSDPRKEPNFRQDKEWYQV